MKFETLNEASEAQRNKSWTTLELASVPLPSELQDRHTVVATEESLADRFGKTSSLKKKVSLSGTLEHAGRRSRTDSLNSNYPQQPSEWLKNAFHLLSQLPIWKRPPVFAWLPRYSRELLQTDLVAGLTVGVVLIPQGVAYAMLAELPPIYGLYASLLPLPVYAMMCSSRHMSIGPFALVSLLVADSVSTVVSPSDTEAYISAVMLLSLMIGLLHILMAAFNLGIIIRFISDSVLAGFTSAAAILISTSQAMHRRGWWPWQGRVRGGVIWTCIPIRSATRIWLVCKLRTVSYTR